MIGEAISVYFSSHIRNSTAVVLYSYFSDVFGLMRLFSFQKYRAVPTVRATAASLVRGFLRPHPE
jgi:hypothetical protein